MPIFEFRCSKCGNIQEFLVRGSSEEAVDMQCKACQSEEGWERVMSSVSYAMGRSGSGGESAPRATTRTCAPGKSCTTIELPGHSK
jgi:putative FmdB family regulatory protein